MKHFILSILLLASGQLFAQNDKYVAKMVKYTALYDSAKNLHDYRVLDNVFAQIGELAKDQWLPYYYAALVKLNAGWLDRSDPDGNAEKINAILDKAEGLATVASDQAEIYVLREVSATQQMMADPQHRYQTYSSKAAEALNKARTLDENNPRIYYLEGMRLFNTPKMFGGGKDKAKPMFEKALALYKASITKQFYPKWGKTESLNMLANCD